MEGEDYSKRNLGPKQYNPGYTPRLFTELDPAGLQTLRDEDGNELTPFEAEVKKMLVLVERKKGFDMANQSVNTDKLMKAQAEGDFKLTKSAYLQFLEQCKDGDLTYVRMRKNKLGRQTNVIFFGANFNDNFPSKNLYKALNVAKPDLVMVQLSPEHLLNDFEQRPQIFNREKDTWEFCPRKYINQLVR